jgi:hypothetical protein
LDSCGQDPRAHAWLFLSLAGLVESEVDQQGGIEQSQRLPEVRRACDEVRQVSPDRRGNDRLETAVPGELPGHRELAPRRVRGAVTSWVGLEVAVLTCRTFTAWLPKTVKLPDVACARSGDLRGHQGLEGIGPQPIGTAGEVPLLEVCTCGMVHDL